MLNNTCLLPGGHPETKLSLFLLRVPRGLREAFFAELLCLSKSEFSINYSAMNGSDEMEKVTWRTPLVRLKVLISALLIAFVCYGFFTWILWPVKVAGQSMMPNYHDGSRHFINKLAYASSLPQRGDVVGVRTDDGEVYIKRIVGLPGEKLHVERGEILIDDKRLDEPYIDSRIPLRAGVPFTELGRDEYFVIGDNRATSIHRRVRRSDIIGKVVY